MFYISLWGVFGCQWKTVMNSWCPHMSLKNTKQSERSSVNLKLMFYYFVKLVLKGYCEFQFKAVKNEVTFCQRRSIDTRNWQNESPVFPTRTTQTFNNLNSFYRIFKIRADKFKPLWGVWMWSLQTIKTKPGLWNWINSHYLGWFISVV